MNDFNNNGVHNTNSTGDDRRIDFEARGDAGEGNENSLAEVSREIHGSTAGDSASGGAAAEEDRKLFIGNLSSEITEKQLRNYFSEFGEVANVYIKRDFLTGRPRGFAFVEFTNEGAIDKVNIDRMHVINNRTVDVKKAKARQGKIFVGGITEEMAYNDIEAHFSKFGNVVSIQMPYNKDTNKRRNFCFVLFDSLKAANEAIISSKQIICGKAVDVNSVFVKTDRNIDYEDMREGPGPMRGGRGGYGGLRYPYHWGVSQQYYHGDYTASPYYRYMDYGYGDFGYTPGKQMWTDRSGRHQPY